MRMLLPYAFLKGFASLSRLLRGARSLVLVALTVSVYPQEQTVGLFLNTDQAETGYTLFSPLRSEHTYLINNSGEVVHHWLSDYVPGNTLYLRENGNLVRTADPGGNSVFVAGGDSGLVQEFTWDGELLWEFLYSDAEQRAHHDIALLPNGNILMIAWEYKSAEQALSAGRDPGLLDDNELWPEKIVEIKPTPPLGGTIVWEWHVWDHLIQDFDPEKENFGDVAAHPERVDINFVRQDGRADWLHANSMDYHPELDQILLNVPAFGEFWAIDHSTTTEEAAGSTGGVRGRGGDLLYRWGNPRSYRAGTEADQHLFWQHGTHWIPPGRPGAGNILVFNNGNGRPEGPWSSVIEIVPPLTTEGDYLRDDGAPFGPPTPVWIYEADPRTDMYSSGLSIATRQPNGNTLICVGSSGDFREVTDLGELVWRYVNPMSDVGAATQGGSRGSNAAFRAERYPLDFPGFQDRELSSEGVLELDPAAELLLSVSALAGGATRVEWASIPTAVYSVDFSELSIPAQWSGVATQTAIGTRSSFTDSQRAWLGGDSGIYRIRRLSP